MAIGTLDTIWSKPHFIEEEIQVQRKEAVARVARGNLATSKAKDKPSSCFFSLYFRQLPFPLGQSLLPLPCPMHPKAIILSVHLTVYQPLAVFPLSPAPVLMLEEVSRLHQTN